VQQDGPGGLAERQGALGTGRLRQAVDRQSATPSLER
jgi:hypothetical protein